MKYYWNLNSKEKLIRVAWMGSLTLALLVSATLYFNFSWIPVMIYGIPLVISLIIRLVLLLISA
ncbi:MAG: hypothetical protein ABS939_24220 [Psychrobacillus sp.]